MMQFHPSEADIGTVIQLGGGGAVAARRTAAVEPPDADDDPATTARLVGLHDLFEGPGKQDVVAAEESEQFPLCGERVLVDRVEDPVVLARHDGAAPLPGKLDRPVGAASVDDQSKLGVTTVTFIPSLPVVRGIGPSGHFAIRDPARAARGGPAIRSGIAGLRR